MDFLQHQSLQLVKRLYLNLICSGCYSLGLKILVETLPPMVSSFFMQGIMDLTKRKPYKRALVLIFCAANIRERMKWTDRV